MAVSLVKGGTGGLVSIVSPPCRVFGTLGEWQRRRGPADDQPETPAFYPCGSKGRLAITQSLRKNSIVVRYHSSRRTHVPSPLSRISQAVFSGRYMTV